MCMKKGWYILHILSLFLLIASITRATEVKINHLQLLSFSSEKITDDTTKKAKQNPQNSSARPAMPPVGCNLEQIRDSLTKDTNIVELLNLNNDCSLYFINKKSMSGPNAQAYAQTFGANLISIQSAKENDDLRKALVDQGFGSSVVWIGFSDKTTEGTFEWFDGSAVTYTNWKQPNEPNNAGDEDCTQIFADGFWNDLNCDGYNSLSVIEVNLCPVTTIAPVKPTIICLGDKLTLDTKTILGAPAYSYSWTSNPAGFTSNLESPEVSPLVNTTYSVDVTDRYGCKSSSTIAVTVNALSATITPSGPISICDGDSVVLTASAGAGYLWSTSETTQSITVRKGGIYTVGVSNPPCVKTASATVILNPAPLAKFGNTTACLGTGTQFTDLSINSTSWGWDFGDGSQGIGQNPNHTYAKAGVYKVTLAVEGPGKCTDTIQQSVTVYDTPKVSFYSYNTCTKDSIYFSNTSTVDSLTTIVSYLYDFGDGKTGNMADMAHLYTKGGNYKVKLTVKTSENCTGSAIVNTPVFDSPTASATGIQNYCSNDTALFINKSTIGGGKIAKFHWIFGDGSVDSTKWDVKHLYTAGTYTVMLALISDNGCADTLKKEIEIFPDVVADFTAPDVCLEEPTNFTNLSTGPVDIYTWDFNDNSTESLRDPSHIYTQAGIYSVKLTVSTTKNCSSTIIKKIAVHELPDAKFTAPNACDGKNVVFTDQSIIPGNSAITKWEWNFGDGSAIDSTQSPKHIYKDVKQYNVRLKVVSNYGCADSVTKVITIYPNPVPDFSVLDTAGCSPFTTTFQNLSTISSGQMTWLWEFGNINSKYDDKTPPPHEFKNTSNTTPVKFTIKLTATSDNLCKVTETKAAYITVLPTPKAAFTLSPTSALVTDPIISFTNYSIGSDSCKWAFADLGMSDSCSPPPFSFVDTGSFVVSLVALNTYGCPDTAYRTVVIEPDYVLYVPNSFTPDADDLNDTFIGKGSFIMDYEMVIYDRWGEVVYQTNDINLPWNGGYKGSTTKLAPAGIYVYSMKIRTTNKKNHSYKGKVMLMR